jgi:hypothetical protein
MYYYNYECYIYREHMVTIHERMRPLNNKSLFIIIIYLLYIIFNYYLYIMSSRCCPNINIPSQRRRHSATCHYCL